MANSKLTSSAPARGFDLTYDQCASIAQAYGVSAECVDLIAKAALSNAPQPVTGPDVELRAKLARAIEWADEFAGGSVKTSVILGLMVSTGRALAFQKCQPDKAGSFDYKASTEAFEQAAKMVELACARSASVFGSPAPKSPGATAYLVADKQFSMRWAVETIYDTFKADLDQGFKTKDKVFAVDIAGAALKHAAAVAAVDHSDPLLKAQREALGIAWDAARPAGGVDSLIAPRPLPDGCSIPFGDCRCSCHTMPGVHHIMPCCYPPAATEVSTDERRGGTLYHAAIRACGELPDGYEIRIELERGCGMVAWYDDEANRTVIDGEGYLCSDVEAAIEAILAKAKGGAA